MLAEKVRSALQAEGPGFESLSAHKDKALAHKELGLFHFKAPNKSVTIW